MRYYIVNRNELIDNKLVRTPIGYVLTKEDALTINSNGVDDYNSFLEGNEDLDVYFETTPIFYDANTTTNYIDGFVDNLITDLNNIE